MAIKVKNGLSLEGQRIQNLGSPSVGTDAVNQDYVQAFAEGRDWKSSVRVASTADVVIASALENGDVIDGVTLATGDRVLLKNQSTASQNGIYVVVASGAASRSADADTSAEVTAGMTIPVTEGTVNGDKRFFLATNDPIVLGTTALVFSQDAGGGLATVATTDSSTIDFSGDGTGGNPLTAVVLNPVRKFAQAIGDGVATVITVTHNLGTDDVTWDLFDASGAKQSHIADLDRPTVNSVRLTFAAAPASGSLRVVVIG